VDEDSVDPRFEAIRLPQVRQAAPGDDECVLQRVLRPAAVAQDSVGDREEDIADLVHQDSKGLPVAATGLLDEV
jgi:hypothetical protein